MKLVAEVVGSLHPGESDTVQHDGGGVGNLAGLAAEPEALVLSPAGIGVGGEQDVVGGGKHLGLLHHELQGAVGRCKEQDVIGVDGDTYKGVTTEDATGWVSGRGGKGASWQVAADLQDVLAVLDINEHEDSGGHRRKLAVKEAPEVDLPGAPVESLGGVQGAGKGWAAVVAVVVRHLQHHPAALRGGAAALVAKGQGVVLQQVAPHVQDRVVQQFQDYRGAHHRSPGVGAAGVLGTALEEGQEGAGQHGEGDGAMGQPGTEDAGGEVEEEVRTVLDSVAGIWRCWYTIISHSYNISQLYYLTVTISHS